MFCVAVKTIWGSDTSLQRINFKSRILQLCSGFLTLLFFLSIKTMCCVHCRTCWQPQESHLTALSLCFSQKEKKSLYKALKRSALSPCTLISKSTHALLCLLLHVSNLVSLMKIPTGKYVGAAEGAVWVCVAAKHLTKVSFCSENLGIICHFYRNNSSWTEGVAGLFHQGSVPSADVELGDFFFPFNWFSSAHVQLYFCTLISPLDGF